MSSQKVRIRYDGPALSENSIDIDDLAPSLLAIGELCKLANRKFNGKNANVKVLVNANLEQNCFELNFELVQTFLSQAKALFNIEEVATAKELLEWIGIIIGGGSVMGLIQFCKFLKGRKIESNQLVEKDGKNVVQIKIEGDNNNVHIHQQTYDLIQDTKAIKKFQKTLKPLSKDGYEKMEFESKNGEIEEITRKDAEQILEMELDVQQLDPQIIVAWLTVFSPVYKIDAKTWKFEFLGKHGIVDISETDIAQNAMKRGGTFVDDIYKVKLEITQKMASDGKIRSQYKIKEVIEFKPSTLSQTDWITDAETMELEKKENPKD